MNICNIRELIEDKKNVSLADSLWLTVIDPNLIYSMCVYTHTLAHIISQCIIFLQARLRHKVQLNTQ